MYVICYISAMVGSMVLFLSIFAVLGIREERKIARRNNHPTSWKV
jgi:hypothetical protein